MLQTSFARSSLRDVADGRGRRPRSTRHDGTADALALLRRFRKYDDSSKPKPRSAKAMLRLSRALVIEDIQRLVEDSIGRIGRHEWTIRGIDCRRERHSHSAPGYRFDLDILNVQARRGASGPWELFIVTEFWRSADGKIMHNPKWLKLVAGKPTDALNWIKQHRQDAA
jgi:hypothetical protein